jgi:hypothetical protein
MTEAVAARWPWWMTPARLVGRFRPSLRAATAADTVAFQRLPRAVVDIGLPLLLIVVVGVVTFAHATSVYPHPSVKIDWLRVGIDDVFTESPVFLFVAIALGVLSPALGILLVLLFGVTDLAAAEVQPYELVPLPMAVAGRLVAIWLLWLLVVEIPVLGRVLASSTGRLAGSRLAVAALSAVVTGGFTFLWTQAAAVLVRPVFTWSSLPSGVRLEAIQPIQVGGVVFAVAAAVAAAAVALAWSGRLLLPSASAPPSQPIFDRLGVPGAVVRRLVVAGLLTVALGGLITVPIDAAVLFVAIAGARPVARWIAQHSPIGMVIERLPPIVRVALAVALVYGIAYLTVGVAPLRKVSDFFSVIAAVAIGIFVVELVVASRASSVTQRPSIARAAGVGAALGLGLLAIGLAAPSSVFADNCASFPDCWNSVLAAILAAASVPILMWIATRDWLYEQGAQEQYEKYEKLRRERHDAWVRHVRDSALYRPGDEDRYPYIDGGSGRKG